MKKIFLALLIFFVFMNQIVAQDIPLYASKIPNSKPAANEEKTEQRNGITIVSKISVPTFRYFPSPEKIATGTAVIIFPGGGYSTNSLSHEGYDIAKKFNEIGVAAFVVKYRIPDDKIMPEKEIGPLQDAQQIIKTVRD